MRERLGAILCLIIVTWASPGAPTPLRPWQEYLYAGDGFAVSAPTQPTLERMTAMSPGGEVELHSYKFPLGGNSGFMVMTNDLNPADRRTPQRILADGEYGAVAAVSGKLVSAAPITFGRYQGVQLEIESPTFRIQSRQYVIERKLYQLVVGAPLGQPLPPETDRFFLSFRLVRASR